MWRRTWKSGHSNVWSRGRCEKTDSTRRSRPWKVIGSSALEENKFGYLGNIRKIAIIIRKLMLEAHQPRHTRDSCCKDPFAVKSPTLDCRTIVTAWYVLETAHPSCTGYARLAYECMCTSVLPLRCQVASRTPQLPHFCSTSLVPEMQ